MRIVAQTPDRLIIRYAPWERRVGGALIVLLAGGSLAYLVLILINGWRGNVIGASGAVVVAGIFVVKAAKMLAAATDRVVVFDRATQTARLIRQGGLRPTEISEVPLKDVRDIAGAGEAHRPPPRLRKYRIVFLLGDGAHVPWTDLPTADIGSQATCVAAARAFGGWNSGASQTHAPRTTATLRPPNIKTPLIVLFSIFGLLSALGAGRVGVEIVRLRTWRPVRATVVSVDPDSRSPRQPRTKTSYLPLVTYTYEVGGHSYTAETVHVLTHSGPRGWAAGITNRYPAGLVTTAYASPSSPSKAFLVHELLLDPLVIATISLILMGIVWFYARSMAQQSATAVAAAVPILSARQAAVVQRRRAVFPKHRNPATNPVVGAKNFGARPTVVARRPRRARGAAGRCSRGAPT